MKYCPCCDTTKETPLFSKNSSRSDGLQSHCKACRSERRKSDYLRNRERELQLSQVWVKDNPNRVKAKAKKHRETLHGRAYYNSRNANRRALRQKAEPKWLTKDQKQDCKAMYTLASKLEVLCGIKYHVDHIVPLNSDVVCGLHVPWNLQVLAAPLNLSKSNKF